MLLKENEPNFLFLQETWHLSNTASHLNNASADYLFKETSGVDSSARILAGRPYGGLAIFYKRSLADKIEQIQCNNKRICAIRYNCDGHSPLLLINVYMPCDNQSSSSLNLTYADTITDVESILTEHTGDVCIAGDWNTDTSRNSAQSVCFNSFIERYDLKLCWDHVLAKRQPTYLSEIIDASSCIDHFIMNVSLFDNIIDCSVNSDPLNPSDHRAISLQIEYVPISYNTHVYEHYKRGISWHKVNSDHIAEYKNHMDSALDIIELDQGSISCNDPLCSDASHSTSINLLCSKIIDILLESGNKCFPNVTPPRQRIPRWNSDIKPLRDDALFWHHIWRDAGSPPTGALAGIMRNTRAKYHKTIKRYKRNMDSYRNSMIACAVENGQQRDIWTELKKLDFSKKVTPSSINGCTDDIGIANIFADKYRNLYSSVPTSSEEIDQIRSEMHNEMNDEKMFEYVNVTFNDVRTALVKLNANKRDGTRGSDSNHFINCSHKMITYIALLINSMFGHGFTPDDLLESVITSIPKDMRGNLCTDDNYRGIALCSCLCKLIDLIIIDKYSDKLLTSDLQFAFKPDHSTNMCTSILKEVCSYYQARNSDVYICLLDASKAFDRVHYGKLFKLLSLRKIPVQVRRLLLDMYTRQKIRTIWNGAHSETFDVKNGVKQGGILSPILFCLYIDELLIRIKDSGLGCHIGHLSYASLGYADDVSAMSPSIKALQSILNICEKFGAEYNVLFNSKKTICMKVGGGGRPPERNVYLNGNKLCWSKKVRHLGNIITHDLNDSEDINLKKGVFISQINKLNCKFQTVHSTLRGRLLQTYCCSWYGCQNWDLAGRSVESMNIEWNKAIRRTLNLPYTTRTCLLPLLVNGKSFASQHKSRVEKFILSFKKSANSRVSYIAKRAEIFSHGALGRNNIRCKRTAITGPPRTDLVARSQTITELMDIRDGLLSIPGIQYDEIVTALNYLCCL